MEKIGFSSAGYLDRNDVGVVISELQPGRCRLKRERHLKM